ncbi:MAG: efflux RND transporter periplasmic adaptor subunit [Bacteroidales bacterium]|nr:efflux RND transporter periplasmic adaptor subunit [Bacteroidales bacterium]
MKHKLIITLTALLIVFVSCNSKPAEPETNARTTFMHSMETTQAVLSHRKEVLMLTGKVETIPGQTINFIPLVSGTVERVFFCCGDRIQRGQNLLTLRSQDLNELYAEKISTETELRIAQRELQTAKALFDDNMLSERELFEAEAEVRQAQVALNRIQNTLSIYGVDSQTGLFTIRSPLTGYVLDMQALSPGSNISAESDEPLFIISDLSTVQVMASVHSSHLRHISVGMDAEITTPTFPDEVFHGKINAISRAFDPEERVLKARITMPNPDLKLKPEMFVEVKLSNQTQELYIEIPSGALIFDHNTHFVVVRNADNTFENRQVVVRNQYNGISFISSGLRENENVVVENPLLIYQEVRRNR